MGIYSVLHYEDPIWLFMKMSIIYMYDCLTALFHDWIETYLHGTRYRLMLPFCALLQIPPLTWPQQDKQTQVTHLTITCLCPFSNCDNPEYNSQKQNCLVTSYVKHIQILPTSQHSEMPPSVPRNNTHHFLVFSMPLCLCFIPQHEPICTLKTCGVLENSLSHKWLLLVQ